MMYLFFFFLVVCCYGIVYQNETIPVVHRYEYSSVGEISLCYCYLKEIVFNPAGYLEHIHVCV